jgi:hypothetical protein
LKKLLKLLALVQAVRHGRSYGGVGAYEPFRRKKWKKRDQRRYGAYGYPPHGYGYGHDPYYGRPRPRGLKGMIVEAILHRLLRR